ncbi:LacI family DNA-binding transcriptional regulator [Isoptericola cucumis]|uniref:LacI family transcriptional regulator n=1 Tax=Isoptericola cucumis TaxID=1776856 RepID=A0ABQ2B9M6_9MICO|nr:LacI family DNA-binding transcriptional regulator [Isoptericola cucumis]GGI08862.1 LacI family transcriptional regulator [Isoptericola cucumis]
MATIEDVARAAGVSASTVSYVLSGKRTISAATRARVERAIAELEYHPHAGARALASSRTDVLALVVPLRLDADASLRGDVDVNVIMQFVAGIVPRARALGYDVLLLTDDDPTALRRVSGGASADALIVMDVESEDDRLPAVARSRTPAILIGMPDDPHGLSCVDFDFDGAGRLAVRHLAGLGHRRVALVGPPDVVLERHTSYADRMLHGLRTQSRSSGVDFRLTLTTARRDAVAAAVSEALDGEAPATALVVHNEAALPAVLDVVRARGLRVPDDLSVVAVCPQNIAEQQAVPLTSIDIPAQHIGATAAEMAVATLRGELEPHTRLVRATLTDRGSTAAAAAA